jgi:hypothetical protein
MNQTSYAEFACDHDCPPAKRVKSSAITTITSPKSTNPFVDLTESDDLILKICLMCFCDYQSVIVENDSDLCEICYNAFAIAHIDDSAVCTCPACADKTHTQNVTEDALKLASNQDNDVTRPEKEEEEDQSQTGGDLIEHTQSENADCEL